MTKEEFLDATTRMPWYLSVIIAKKIFSGTELEEILAQIKG